MKWKFTKKDHSKRLYHQLHVFIGSLEKHERAQERECEKESARERQKSFSIFVVCYFVVNYVILYFFSSIACFVQVSHSFSHFSHSFVCIQFFYSSFTRAPNFYVFFLFTSLRIDFGSRRRRYRLQSVLLLIEWRAAAHFFFSHTHQHMNIYISMRYMCAL